MANLQPIRDKLSSLSLSDERASALENSDANQTNCCFKGSLTSYKRWFMSHLKEPPRMFNDLQNVVWILSSIDSNNLVRNCFRLGKYSVNRSHPLLVKLTSLN